MSELILITITNTSDIEFNDVVIGHAHKNLTLQNHGLHPKIKVKCAKKIDKDTKVKLTYRNFLKTSMFIPFKVGLTCVQSTMGNQSCVTVKILEKSKYKEGYDEYDLHPYLDPYRQASNILRYEDIYEIDGFGKIILTKLYPKAECILHLYEQKKINLRNTIFGACAESKYDTPKIIKNNDL